MKSPAAAVPFLIAAAVLLGTALVYAARGEWDGLAGCALVAAVLCVVAIVGPRA